MMEPEPALRPVLAFSPLLLVLVLLFLLFLFMVFAFHFIVLLSFVNEVHFRTALTAYRPGSLRSRSERLPPIFRTEMWKR